MLKIACIGAGYFSQFHFDGWARTGLSKVVGVTNRDRSKAEATGLPVFDTLAAMLTETDPDILDIIVAPEAHADAIRAGLEHGVRAIVCQKPFCRDLAEAEEMTALAEQTGIPLIVHENIRFQPWYRVIKMAIDDGAIGVPLQASFRLRPGDGQGPEAYLARQPYFQDMERFLIHETGVHWIDTFRFLFGDPEAVYADLRRVNPVIAGEDAGFVLFDHPSGVRVMFDGNRCLDHATQNTRCTMGEGLFEGTEGSLRLLGDGSVMQRSFGAQDETQICPPNDSPNFGGDCTFHLIDHVARAFADGGPIENTAREYLTVMRIEHAVYISAAQQQKQLLSDI
ncbi:MAG: Gfo/Idh/MocA family oxidoreductase [Pseudomonadota bacterium]